LANSNLTSTTAGGADGTFSRGARGGSLEWGSEAEGQDPRWGSGRELCPTASRSRRISVK